MAVGTHDTFVHGSPIMLDVIDGIEVYCITSILEAVYGPEAFSIGYEESGEGVGRAMHALDAFGYSRPRETFDLEEAVHQAREAGNVAVIVEDLS